MEEDNEFRPKYLIQPRKHGYSQQMCKRRHLEQLRNELKLEDDLSENIGTTRQDT